MARATLLLTITLSILALAPTAARARIHPRPINVMVFFGKNPASYSDPAPTLPRTVAPMIPCVSLDESVMYALNDIFLLDELPRTIVIRQRILLVEPQGM